MAQYTSLSKLIAGRQQSPDLSTNTLVLGSALIGGSAGTELTKTLVDNLVTLSGGGDAGALHNHNGAYYTKAQINSVASGTSGASLSGVFLTPTNYTAAAATVEGHLAGINSALGSVSINNFSDALFNVFNSTDNTKKIKLSAAGITTGTTRTITMPDANVDLGNLTNSNIASAAAIAYSKLNLAGSIVNADIATGAAIAYAKLTLSGSVVNADIATGAAIALSKLAALSTNFALVSDGSGIVAVSAVTATELGFLSGVTSSVQSQINNVLSLVQGQEWQNAVLSATLLTPPVSPTTGDRYLINGVGAGAWATHDNSIAQWSGSAWIYTVPVTGTFVASDAEPNVLYLFGGSTWSQKTFENTTASTGLTKVGTDIQLAPSAAGSGLSFTSGVLSVNTDGQSTQVTSGNVVVKFSATGALAADANGSAIQLEATNPTLQIATNKLGVKLNAAGAITTGAAGVGVNIDTGTMQISSNALGIKAQGVAAAQIATGVFDQATITGGNGVAAVVKSAPLFQETLIAGESFAANTSFLVRWALTGETAGRVYKADKDATSLTKYMAFGMAMSTTSVTAGGTINVISLGTAVMGTADTVFTSAQVGLEVFLGSAGAWILGSVLAGTTGEAAYCIGSVQDTNKIRIIAPSLRGIS